VAKRVELVFGVSATNYQAKRLARKNVSEMTYFVLAWDVKP